MAPASVLVIGAGELGKAVLRSLAAHSIRFSVKIAVLLRRSTINSNESPKQKDVDDLKALGIELVEGDVVDDSEQQLANTFSKFHTIINCSGMFLPAGTQKRVAEAAVASSCSRYFPWQFGVDYDAIGPNSSQDLFTEQLDVRAILRGQSKGFVIVSTGMFLSFLFEPAFGIVNDARDAVTALGSWENCITVTSPEDIGKLTAEIALAHTKIKDVVFVAGDTVSMQDVADVVEKALERKVVRQLKTVDHLKQELAADPDNDMRKYRVVFGEGVGISWEKSKSFNAEIGMSTETVEQWASKHLKA